MTTNTQPQDPMDFFKNMWSNMGFPLPGMVTPTLDTNELDRRITDLKAVEGWLRTNLSMLQMTIQGLEMQRNTLATMQAFSQASASGSGGGEANPFASPAPWPWNFMQQAAAGAEAAQAPAATPAEASAGTATKSRKTPAE